MARTERVASTIKRDSMVSEPPMAITILPSDLRQAAAVSDVARALDAPEITEYWKSAPYLLNFMRDYALKRLLKDQLDKPAPNLCVAIERARPAMLDRDRLDAYEPLEPANGRMRGVMDDVFGDGLDQHLWLPPSLPYYGPERSGPPLTKALIFSSWSMVPDAIAAILSYEAERRMGVGASGQRYFGHVRPRPIQFRPCGRCTWFIHRRPWHALPILLRSLERRTSPCRSKPCAKPSPTAYARASSHSPSGLATPPMAAIGNGLPRPLSTPWQKPAP
jgi:hypothetical protein